MGRGVRVKESGLISGNRVFIHLLFNTPLRKTCSERHDLKYENDMSKYKNNHSLFWLFDFLLSTQYFQIWFFIIGELTGWVSKNFQMFLMFLSGSTSPYFSFPYTSTAPEQDTTNLVADVVMVLVVSSEVLGDTTASTGCRWSRRLHSSVLVLESSNVS